MSEDKFFQKKRTELPFPNKRYLYQNPSANITSNNKMLETFFPTFMRNKLKIPAILAFLKIYCGVLATTVK